MKKKYRKLLGDFLTILIGNFGSKLLGFLFIPLYTSILTTSEYGISDLISTTISLLYPIFTLGIGEALNRYLLDKDGNELKYLLISIKIWGIGALAVLFLSPFLTDWILKGQYLWDFFGIYCATTLCEILRHYAKGIEKLKIFSFSGILETGFMIAFNLIFLLIFKMGLKGLLLATQLTEWIICFFFFVALGLYKNLQNVKTVDGSCREEEKKLIKYGMPLLFNSISWWVVISSDKYVLLYFHDTAFNGIYSVAQKIPSIIVNLVAIFINAWNISSVIKFGSDSSKQFFSSVLHKITIIQVSIAALLIAFNRIICKILFSGDFYIAWKYVPILLIGNVWYSIVSFLGSIYTASKKTKNSFYTTVVGAIINIGLNFVLAPRFDIYGVAFATAISYLVTMLIRMIDTKKIINFDMKIRYSIIIYTLLIVEGFLGLYENRWASIGMWGMCLVILCINYKEVSSSVKSVIMQIKSRSKV